MLAVASEKAMEALLFLEQRSRQGLSEVELAAADHVVDLEADELQCPACGTAFANESQDHCPECGLRIG